MALKNLIDPREYERVLRFIEEYGLAAHDPRIALLLRQINAANPGSLDVRLWQQLCALVARFEAFHRDYPFLVAPRETLAGRPIATPLYQAANTEQLTLDAPEVTEHIGIFGRSGGGKTTCAHHFAHEAYARGLNVVTIDGKDDARSFPVLYPETITIDQNTPLPLLELPAWLTRPEARRQITKPLRENMWGGEGLEQVASESHAHTIERHAHPSVADWRDEVRSLAKKGDTYTRRDRCDGLALRLERLISQYPGIGTTRAGTGIPLELLCTRSVYFGFGLHTEIEDFITQWLLELRFSYNRAHHLRSLNTLVLLDESNLLVHDRTIAEQAPLVATFPLLREFGIGVLLTAAHYKSVPAPIRASLYLQIAMNLTDSAEATEIARTFGLSQEQRAYLDTKLTRGTCVVKLGDRWKHALLATFAPRSIDKKVDPTAWREALARMNQVARPDPSLNTIPRNSASPAIAEPQIPSNVVSSNAPRRIALNRHAVALLRDVAEHPYTLTTASYDRCGLHWQQGDRAKSLVLKLGLASTERVRTGAGRGKTGSAMWLTNAGYARLERVPAKVTRGGSAQHHFLAYTLARATGGTVECLGADLLVKVDSTRHEKLLLALNRSIPDGSLVSIQIEVSDSRKTIPPNAARDAETGFDFTAFAVMPEHLSAARKIVTESDRILLVDVLQLVEDLR